MWKALWWAAKALMKGSGALIGAVDALYRYWEAEAKNWGSFDKAAKDVSHQMGLTREQSELMRDTLIETQLELGKIYNVSAEEIASFNSKISSEFGRVINLTSEAKENFAALKLLMPNAQIEEMASNMDAFGTSLETASAYLYLTRAQAEKFGLNANKATGALVNNIKALSKFGFKQGVNDIQQMTLWSQKLKVNFDSIASATKNFNTIQGAIENSAKIQMLGGEMSYQYMNPLEVMSEAMFDTKSFGERIANTVAHMGTFDKKSGTVRVESWLDRAKIQHYADAVGVSFEELLNMANQQRKYQEIDQHINQSLSEEQRQAVANMAQFNADSGRWEVVDAVGQRYDVASINSEQMLEKIAANTVSRDRDTNIKNIAGNVAKIAAWASGEAQDMIDYNARFEGREKTIKASRAKATSMLGLQNRVEGIHKTLTSMLSSMWVMIPLIGLRSVASLAAGAKVGAKIGAPKAFTNMVTHVAGYERGGIVGGSYPEGDQLLARVNSEEMILNKEQQASLFNIANGALPIAMAPYTEPRAESNSSSGGYFRRSSAIAKPTSTPVSQTIQVRSNLARELDGIFTRFAERQRAIWQNFLNSERNALMQIKNSRLATSISTKFTSASNYLSNLYTRSSTAISTRLSNASTHMSNMYTKLGNKVNTLTNNFANMTTRATNYIQQSRAYSVASRGATMTRNAISRATTSVSNAVNSSRTMIGNVATRISNSRIANASRTVARGASSVARGASTVMKPFYELTRNSLQNTNIAVRSMASSTRSAVVSSAKGLATRANSRLASSFVGKASSSLASKGATRLVGRLVKGGGPAALASIGIEGLNYAGQKLGWWKEDSHAAKGMNIASTTLGYAATGAMIGSFIPVIGNAVGGLVGGAIGLVKSTYDNYNKCNEARPKR